MGLGSTHTSTSQPQCCLFPNNFGKVTVGEQCPLNLYMFIFFKFLTFSFYLQSFKSYIDLWTQQIRVADVPLFTQSLVPQKSLVSTCPFCVLSHVHLINHTAFGLCGGPVPLKPLELLLARHHQGSEGLEVNCAALSNSLIVSGIFVPHSKWLVV